MRSRLTAKDIIRILKLEPLTAEGGLFIQSYRSDETIPPGCLAPRYKSGRKPFGTAIYYLLTNEDNSFSALHRLPTDEILHFYLGDPLESLLLYPDGSSRKFILGQDLLSDQKVQFVVPKDVWQGHRLVPGGKFALIGSTMAPGFTENDYEGGIRSELIQQYPEQEQAIIRLTREGGLTRMS